MEDEWMGGWVGGWMGGAGLSIRAITGLTPVGLSIFDAPLMLQVNQTVVDTIHPQSNKFAIGVKIKATELKLNDSPVEFMKDTFFLI